MGRTLHLDALGEVVDGWSGDSVTLGYDVAALDKSFCGADAGDCGGVGGIAIIGRIVIVDRSVIGVTLGYDVAALDEPLGSVDASGCGGVSIVGGVFGDFIRGVGIDGDGDVDSGNPASGSGVTLDDGGMEIPCGFRMGSG